MHGSRDLLLCSCVGKTFSHVGLEGYSVLKLLAKSFKIYKTYLTLLVKSISLILKFCDFEIQHALEIQNDQYVLKRVVDILIKNNICAYVCSFSFDSGCRRRIYADGLLSNSLHRNCLFTQVGLRFEYMTRDKSCSC